MTEQEAIEIHTAENIHRIEVIEDFMHTNSDADDAVCRKNIAVLSKINGLLQIVQQYRTIGTPEECRAAVEKQMAKKPTPIDYKRYIGVVKNAKFLIGAYWCPNCNRVVRSGKYCDDCGQKLDWSDEE